MEKFCTRCGKKFVAVGREVICPSCKAAAAEETKRAAVLKAKRASWTGESVPVRISGRASTVIRQYGTANNLPFAAALDALLKASDFLKESGKAWEEIEPYKSHRRDKATSTAETVKAIDELLKQTAQDVPQEAQDVPQKTQDAKTAAKTASKATASKASASKAAGKAASKASNASKK